MPYVFERFEYLGTAPALISFDVVDNIVDRITDRMTKRLPNNQNAPSSPSTIMKNIIRNSFPSIELNSKFDIPPKGDVLTFEMPVSGSLIRFIKK